MIMGCMYKFTSKEFINLYIFYGFKTYMCAFKMNFDKNWYYLIVSQL